MRNGCTSRDVPRPTVHRSWASDRGVAIAEVLYALSIFSVLSLTSIVNRQFEETFRTNTSPDLHVVLYSGGAGTHTVIGRLNLPTYASTAPGASDPSIVVKVPALSAGPVAALLSPGSSYSAQFEPGLKVCCDGGDNACGGAGSSAAEQGTLNPPITSRLNVADTFHELKFNLTSFEKPENLEFDPNASVENGVLVKATRVADFDATQAQASAGGYVVCRLQQGQSILATGLLRLDAPIDPGGQSSRLRGGSVHMKYLAPVAAPVVQPSK
jgi:hypothetical protein